MAEKFTLSTPVSVTDYDIVRHDMQWRDSRLVVEFIDNNGKIVVAIWEGAQALTIMRAINKANFSGGATSTLRARLFQQAATDGKLTAGNVTGTPD